MLKANHVHYLSWAIWRTSTSLNEWYCARVKLTAACCHWPTSSFTDAPPELDHLAFVSLGSCADIPKALPVLAAMGIKACAVVDLDFCYTHARSSGLLGKDAEDLSDAKARLARMQPDHGFTLSGNGLPQNDKPKGWMAADVWAQFAADDEGRAIAEHTHEALKANGVWAWKDGCIEQVTNTVDKGEEAIIEQEQRLRAMAAADIEQQMPAFKACFDWIRGL